MSSSSAAPALRAVLAGTGISVPPRKIDNLMLARVMETNDEWIVERSGISTRFYVEPGIASSDLGTEAAAAALEDAGMAAGELDYIVCATMTPDHYFPGAGTSIQQKLGIDPLPALDIRQHEVVDLGSPPGRSTTSCWRV